MKSIKKKALTLNNILPLGVLSFGILYLYSSTLYPGGSQADLHSEGFDWINNYWCNLMNEKGMNGETNPARPFAIFAMIILCFSLSIFFFQFSEFFTESKLWKNTIKIAGITSMFFAALIFTKYHDLMTIISSLFGIFVLIGIIRGVYKSHLHNYKITGVFCIVLLGLNNYIYYSNHFLEWLPLIQKITFLIVLFWVVGLNYELRKIIKSSNPIVDA